MCVNAVAEVNLLTVDVNVAGFKIFRILELRIHMSRNPNPEVPPMGILCPILLDRPAVKHFLAVAPLHFYTSFNLCACKWASD